MLQVVVLPLATAALNTTLLPVRRDGQHCALTVGNTVYGLTSNSYKYYRMIERNHGSAWKLISEFQINNFVCLIGNSELIISILSNLILKRLNWSTRVGFICDMSQKVVATISEIQSVLFRHGLGWCLILVFGLAHSGSSWAFL